MTRTQHAARIVALMIVASGLLGWLARHTGILFADGLRYVEQAKRIDYGALSDGLFRSVDHPAYPVTIALVHRALGSDNGPEAWQAAAQIAAILAGIALMMPLYLVTLELFGDRAAWLACLLAIMVPQTGHVLADALSESTFLLFWLWGLWTALRFLRDGAFGWLPPMIGFAALAYLSRPEGLLLPAALVATLGLLPLLRSTRMNWPRWWAAIGFLVLGPGMLIGPYVAMKGGLGTKPAVQRMLGTAPRSAPDAVERQRPLDPNQSTARTYAQAGRAVLIAIRDAATLPVLALAALGFARAWPPGVRSRAWLLLGVIAVASVLALIRLHATGGYCSPRHAMVLAFLLFPAAAAGLDGVLRSAAIPGRWLGLGEGRFTAGPAVWALVLVGFGAWCAPNTLAPLNDSNAGYRDAGYWLKQNVPATAWVVDVTGWSLFYGERPGYTFANLDDTARDPNIRWVIAREAHLRGPWRYCDRLRRLVGEREPIVIFPVDPRPKQSKVFVFDLLSAPIQQARAEPGPIQPDRR